MGRLRSIAEALRLQLPPYGTIRRRRRDRRRRRAARAAAHAAATSSATMHARGAETLEQRAELRAGCAAIRARLRDEPTGGRRHERLHDARQILVAHRGEHDPRARRRPAGAATDASSTAAAAGLWPTSNTHSTPSTACRSRRPRKTRVRDARRERRVADRQRRGERSRPTAAHEAAFANCSSPPKGGKGNDGAVSGSRVLRQRAAVAAEIEVAADEIRHRALGCGVCSSTLCGTARSPITTGLPEPHDSGLLHVRSRHASRRATRDDRDRC